MRGAAVLLVLLAGICLTGCGSSRTAPSSPASRPFPPDYVPVTVGAGADYRPAATSAAVRAGLPVDGQACTAGRGARYGAHLEVFVDQHVVAIPAGIGIEPPTRTGESERITSGRCFYPALTDDPTGVIELSSGRHHTLGQLFAIWGQPLARQQLLGFHVPADLRVVAYDGTTRWSRPASAIPLERHTRVVLELRSSIPPHRTYAFPPGL